MSSKRSRAAFESGESAPPRHAPYASYGTPLPAYDAAARDDGSYVPVWKQEVTDERGRKRLHGAFTGGWSAGYFNTVGSKEGWTPSTFVSSRSNRASDQAGGKARQQRPEDFMDDEDLAEQAESQKLETQGVFAGLGSSGESGNVRGVFADLFRTTGETMGVKLLQRMGWRRGQGIGAKVKRHAHGDNTGDMHLFAPENSRIIAFHRKIDRKGLGFAGEEKLDSRANRGIMTKGVEDGEDSDRDDRILQTHRSKILSKPKKIKKTSIGVGVLNDTGSDDEDPYAMGPQINYNRIAGGQQKRKKGPGAGGANPAMPKPILTSKKLSQRTNALTGFRKCHDGRLPLEGFVLSTAQLTVVLENKYPPSTVPEGWKPSKSTQVMTDDSKSFQSTADIARASTLDPKSRAALLDEQALPGKSVFDFISSAARDRLVTASGKTDLPRGLGEGAPLGFETSEAEKRRTLWDLVPSLDKQTAASALQRGSSGWMPYAEDETKRDRYRIFLELRAGIHSRMPARPKTFSVDEWAGELREFAQAAEVFRPISGLMASRFTSSSTTPQLASDAPESKVPTVGQREEGPAEKAAKMDMFGPLTRSRHSFSPTRLLCKRFGVPLPSNVGVDPEAEGDDVGENDRLAVVNQASMDRMMREVSFQLAGSSVSTNQDQLPPVRKDPPAPVDVEMNAALEGQKAGEAVFRAIFGSDDEEED